MRRLLAWSLVLCAGALLIALAVLYDPATGRFSVPPAWDPRAPLDLDDAPNAVWRWKLSRALDEPARCKAVLGRHAVFEALPDRTVSASCGIAGRVRLSRLSVARLRPVETTCGIALRLYLWERHGLRPAALEAFGAPVTALRHFGSYSCRTIAGSTRMSRHARARAIDIAGFTRPDGREISLKRGWDGTDPATRRFLRAARASACDWFTGVLSPDYNAAHADHFHLEAGGWNFCR